MTLSTGNIYCCSTLKYLVEDERTENTDNGRFGVWTSRLPYNGDWEPELLELHFCPNCGARLE